MIQFEIPQRISISANISIFTVIKKNCTVQICLAALALQRYIYVTKPAHIFISLETKHLYTPPFLSSRSPHPKASAVFDSPSFSLVLPEVTSC